jgi:hypothetical protein
MHTEPCSPTNDYRTKSGGREPAVVRESHRQRRACLAERGCLHATGGLRPPLLCCHRECLPTKKRFLRWTNACSQERRALARRGSVNRTLPRENRTLCSGYRTPIQERRALARRGSMTHLHWPAFFAEPKRPRRTAGSRQALLVGSASAARSMRIPSAGSIRFPGWLTLVSPKKEPRAPGAVTMKGGRCTCRWRNRKGGGLSIASSRGVAS